MVNSDNLSFPRTRRISSSEDFAEIKKRGVRFYSGPFRVTALNSSSHRIGIVVPKAVGGAVSRNRIRRIAREFFRTGRQTIPECDLLVLVNRGAAELTAERVRFHLQEIFTKISAASRLSK